MKITHNKIGQNLNLTDASRADKSKQSGSASSISTDKTKAADALKDLGVTNGASDSATKVDLSERSQDIRQIKEMALASPDVDQAKVDKFRKLIDEGKYKVDAKSVADRMVDEHMFNSGATSNE